MSIFHAVLLALIQGITEFLPVSSSGNLVLFQHWFGIPGEQLTFSVVVHIASALAILFFFVTRIRTLVRELWYPVVIGTLPIIAIGLIFKDIINSFFENTLLVSLGLFVTGGLNVVMDGILRKRNVSKHSESLMQNSQEEEAAYTISWKKSILIGFFQAFAVIPGISRSGSTVFAGLVCGLPRKKAFEFSFLLALPAIGGATVLQFAQEFEWGVFTLQSVFTLPHIIGFGVSFIASYASLWLLRFMMQEAQFWWFAVYCFGLGIAGLLLSFL